MDTLYSYSMESPGDSHNSFLLYTVTTYILLQSTEVDFEILWPQQETLKLFQSSFKQIIHTMNNLIGAADYLIVHHSAIQSMVLHSNGIW